ncbi:S-layer homology domain-containing protein [Paenibacillus sp. y28]|uniref:S-layer homology domain-containing protein n=1 Tax=Paenibacillus sp. y28 TaxID=3129110 RepID=UPI0030196C82
MNRGTRAIASLWFTAAVWWAAPAGASLTAHAEQSVHFSDIEGHWAQAPINKLVEKGILDGFPDGTFRPNDPVTADQFIKMLLLSFTESYKNGERAWTSGFTQSLSATNQEVLKQDYRDFNFKPSMTGYWAKPFIDLAADLNLVSKTQFADFKKNLKREQAAEFIYYTMKETEHLESESYSLSLTGQLADFQSAKSREQKFIAESFAKGIMEGYPNGDFGIGRDITRAESLTLLERIADKTKRIQLSSGSGQGWRMSVPTRDGSYKQLLFPSEKMMNAYDILLEAAKRRGTNYDMLETTMRLYKDAETKAKALNRTPAAVNDLEEAALWLEPEYATYGITVHLAEGVLARNMETIRTFAQYIFGYETLRFEEAFNQAYAKLEQGAPAEDETIVIGDYAVEIQFDRTRQTVIFSILENNTK